MSDPIQALFQVGLLRKTLFPETSRYHEIETTEFTRPDGTVVVHLRRRFVPAPERFALLQEHPVREGDRLDNVTARYLGDPEQFWRICDANGVLRPNVLVESVGGVIRITLPVDVPGPGDE